jgi:glycosyltransferase involved in cell wall biosynthesis
MRKKAAVIYPFVPHYRKPVFSVLSKCSALFDYVFFADEKATDKTIRSEKAGAAFEMRIAPVCERKGLVWQSGLFRVVIGSEFDVLVFLGNPYYISTWVYAVLGRLFGKRVYFWTHGWLSRDPLLKRSVRNLFYKIPHGLLLYGDRAVDLGLSYGFERRRLHVIYNSLDYPAQQAERIGLDELAIERFRLPDALRNSSMFAACIARLTSQCKFEMAIDALALLRRDEGIAFPLVLIGDGPVRNSLALYASEKGVDVVFLGELYGESEVGPVLYAARMVISPGKVGLTAMHSLAYGTPVITHGDFDHQGPEVEAISDGVNGSFFRVGDVEDLARKISFWARKKRGPDERKACFSVVEERYTPKRQLQLIEAAISQDCV